MSEKLAENTRHEPVVFTLPIINLAVKILTNSNNLLGNPLYWTIFLLRKCIPALIKVGRRDSQRIHCCPLSQIKVGSFCFSAPVRRAGCGGLLVSTDCVRRRWCWSALLWATAAFAAFFSSTFSRHCPENTWRISWKSHFPSFFSPVNLSPVNHGQNWRGRERSGEKGLIISDNQAQTCLIITINDTSTGDLPLIITISDTCKNQPKRFDFDNTINLSSLIVRLDRYWCNMSWFTLTHTVSYTTVTGGWVDDGTPRVGLTSQVTVCAHFWDGEGVLPLTSGVHIETVPLENKNFLFILFNKFVFICLLLIDKTRAKDKTYIWVSVRWKTKN